MSEKKLRIRLVKSPIGYNKTQKKTVEALGLRRINATVVRKDTPQLRGMIEAVRHLVLVEETTE